MTATSSTPTSSHGVGPKLDAYGIYARASALADYLEVQALLGRPLTAAELADIAVEQGWSRKQRRSILVAAEDLEDDPDSWSEMAFAAIAERVDILEEKYPFTEVRGAVTYAGPPVPHDDPYIALLCLSVVHAWDLPSPVDPTVVHEDVTRRVLEARSMLAADMGTGDRSGLSFVENLSQQGRRVGLTPMEQPLPRATSAKDEGVDTLGTIAWSDRRRGQWVYIGQVTCGSSATWRKKLKEPDPELWRDYLQEALLPLPFLSVPHHIDERAWAYLMGIKHGLLLDRLRICEAKGPNSSDERTLVDVVLAAVPS